MNWSGPVLIATGSFTGLLLLMRPDWLLLRTRLPAGERVDPHTLIMRVLPLALATGGFVAFELGGLPYLILGLAFAIALIFGLRRWAEIRAARKIREGEEWVRELVETLAAEIRSGVLPHVCLERLASEFPELNLVAERSKTGGDMHEAWSAIAALPGAADLEKVALAWSVSARSGSPLAQTLSRVADDLRLGEQVRHEVAGAVAPARSTAVVMAVLPFLTLSTGSALGGSPLETITGSIAGAGTVALGVIFAVCGLAWVEQIVKRAETE